MEQQFNVWAGEDEGVEGSGENSKDDFSQLHFDGSLREGFENTIKLFRKLNTPDLSGFPPIPFKITLIALFQYCIAHHYCA